MYTVSASAILDVVSYISTQRKHHRVMTFEEDFVILLENHEVDYDPKYLWD